MNVGNAHVCERGPPIMMVSTDWNEQTRTDSPFAKRKRTMLQPGYAYVAKGDLATIQNEDWETRIVVPRGDEYECGRIRIDGVLHRVFWSPKLQANVAQVMTGD